MKVDGKFPGKRVVPSLYKEVTNIVQTVEKHEGGVRNLVFQSKHSNKRALLALALKTLEHKANLKTALETAGLINENTDQYKSTLLSVLTSELVWGSQKLAGASAIEKVILHNRDKLEQALVHVKPSNTPCPAVARYVRVNTLSCSIEEVSGVLDEEGWERVDYDEHISYDEYVELVRGLEEAQYLLDLHVPHLLVFHPKTEFHQHYLYTSLKILLQDKASCLASLTVRPHPGDVILDACAGPGMKSTHIAAQMNNHGKLICVEKDGKRAETLRELVGMSGASVCDVKEEDFTKLNPEDFTEVTTILLDPSCSGSGMAKRLYFPDNEQIDKNSDYHARLMKLQSFQVMMLKHALSFPSVKRVVYSTCSIREEENEAVISEVIEEFSNHFRLARVIKNWPNRGLPAYPFGKKCLRTSLNDLCNGSFIAKFKRRKIATETLDAENITAETLDAENVTVETLDAENITADTLVAENTNAASDSPQKIKKKKKKHKKSAM